jgi:hypothetical protein
VRHERVTFARRERSHRRRFPVALMFVEDRQIRLDDLAQDAHATTVPPSLRSTMARLFAEVALACAGCFGRMSVELAPRAYSRALAQATIDVVAAARASDPCRGAR